jgi:hypothetical protein
LLVKYNAPTSFVHHQNNQDQAGQEISKRKYQNFFETIPDWGPVIQSNTIINNGGFVTTENIQNETSLNQINSNFSHDIVEMTEAVNLIQSWDLIDPIERFEAQMAFQKPKNLIKKRLQLAQESKCFFQQLESDIKAASKNSLIFESEKWKNCVVTKHKGPTI